MGSSSSGIFVSLAALCATACLAGCSTTASETRWSRHFDSAVWGGSLVEQLERPECVVPEAVLLASIPLAYVYDQDLQDAAEDSTISDTSKSISTVMQVVLPVIPVTIGVVDWANGDGGERFEVVAESLLSVVAVQQLLARTVGRERPNGEDDQSFPSGHTSWAFAATTLIVRGLHDPADSSFRLTDTLLYLPAVFAGWERIAEGKHWASDTACGAFIGVFLTNWIWDAHYSDGKRERETVFETEHRHGFAFRPTIDVVEGQVMFGIAGGF